MSTTSDAENDTLALRNCLGNFATGVTIVTCIDKDGVPQGVTANSFSSVSLEPPLVLWNIGKVSNTLDQFLAAERFAINILARSQEHLSNHFAQTGVGLFEQVDYIPGENGAPLFAEALAVLECSQHQVHEAGDHYIILGTVTRFDTREDEPLLFYRGGYSSLV